MPLVLPPRVEFDQQGLEGQSFDQLTELALRLYRESRSLITAAARYHEPAEIARPQAVCCGLLARMTKFMRCIDVIASTLAMSADVLLAMNRCMLETAVNVMFLLHSEDPDIYDDFMKKGLGPDREFYDSVQANIAVAGGPTPMEERILASIQRLVQQSGLRIEDIPVRHQEWGGNMREKIAAIGWDGLYIPYRGGSHAVHGTWADVLMRHLIPGAGGYSIQWSLGSTDSRLLHAPARINLEATGYYAAEWFEEADRQPLFERLEVLIADLEAVSLATEGAMQQEPKDEA